MFIIKYGTRDLHIDVTHIAYDTMKTQNMIIIPAGDSNRAKYFTDPVVGILKTIFIIDGNCVTEYDHTKTICIDTINNKIVVTSDLSSSDKDKLQNIHRQLKIKHGIFTDEYPEQLMAVKYITGSEKVLEIGGNIGRNSMVIAYLLQQQNNLVTLECDPEIAAQLIENRNINQLTFQVEDSALSKRNLIQKGWTTFVSDVIPYGYKKVKTITLSELNNKYQIQFDTLVLDCEGAFYYILQDFPEILNKIKLIIMENDYFDITHKNYVDMILKQTGFTIDYVEAGGWGPCYSNFYEVWKKN